MTPGVPEPETEAPVAGGHWARPDLPESEFLLDFSDQLFSSVCEESVGIETSWWSVETSAVVLCKLCPGKLPPMGQVKN